MNSAAIQKLRGKLGRKECCYGLWVTLEAASITEMAVFLGLDWVVLDAEHGHLDWGDLVGHLRAAVRSDTVVLIRLMELNTGAIKRALDIGADGVLIPWIESAEQLRQAVAAAHFPPAGVRGIGAERATHWGQRMPEHVVEAEKNVLVIPMIESVPRREEYRGHARRARCRYFLFRPGRLFIDGRLRGPMGRAGRGGDDSCRARKDRGRRKIQRRHRGRKREFGLRKSQGFQMLAVGLDGSLMMRSIRDALAAVARRFVHRAVGAEIRLVIRESCS